MLGVLAAAFWLIPAVGLARSAAVCIALNLLCGVIALGRVPEDGASRAGRPPAPDRARARGVVWRLAFTGLLGIGYEVLVVRVLSQVTEDTVYTFAMLLAVYLVGSAAGAAGYQRWLEGRGRDRDDLGDQLLAALAAACLAGTASLWGAERVKAMGAGGVRRRRRGRHRRRGSAGAGGVRAADDRHGRAVQSPEPLPRAQPASASGARWASTCWPRRRRRRSSASSQFPALGPKLALLLIGVGYLASTARRAWSTKTVLLPAAGALAVALFAPPLTFVDVPEGGRVVSYQEGVMAAVSVVEDADGVARLRINNRQQEGSSATLYVDARQAWLPLLLHPAPRRALFLGLGTGVTASSAAEDPTLDVDAVELLPEVIAASTHFTRRSADGAATSRLHVVAADARRYVRASDRSYDVIVSDNFHPARSGSGALYTVEHFEAVRRRLDAAGRVLPVAAAAPARSRDSAQHRALLRDGLSTGLGHDREQQPGDTRARSGRPW